MLGWTGFWIMVVRRTATMQTMWLVMEVVFKMAEMSIWG